MRENPELFSFALESGKNSNAHGVMVDMYSRTGFEPVAKVRFNSEYAPEGWNFDELGEPYICVMAHNGESVDDVVRNMVLEPGGINHSESSRNNQSELIANAPAWLIDYRYLFNWIADFYRIGF